MKVIKPAPEAAWSHQWVCKGCGATLEAEMKDLKARGYAGESVDCYLECPTEGCGEKVYFVDTKLPARVAHFVQAQRSDRPPLGPKD